jgi:hypothetical protein
MPIIPPRRDCPARAKDESAYPGLRPGERTGLMHSSRDWPVTSDADGRQSSASDSVEPGTEVHSGERLGLRHPARLGRCSLLSLNFRGAMIASSNCYHPKAAGEAAPPHPVTTIRSGPCTFWDALRSDSRADVLQSSSSPLLPARRPKLHSVVCPYREPAGHWSRTQNSKQQSVQMASRCVGVLRRQERIGR